MAGSLKRVAVITPMLNERGSVLECLATVAAVGRKLLAEGVELEHVVVDDGSTDDTGKMLDMNEANAGKWGLTLDVIHHDRNRGANEAVWTAILRVEADAYVLLLPADLQDPPTAIPQMVQKWRYGARAVYGVRCLRSTVEPRALTWCRSLYYRIVSALAAGPIVPHAGLFVLVDKSIVQQLRQRINPNVHPLPYLSTFLARFVTAPERVYFAWRPRRVGKSRYRFGGLVREAMRGIYWCRDWRKV